MTTRQAAQLAMLEAQGFDTSTPTRTYSGHGARVACSQCQAAVINGVACHEHGCPHQTYECKGCGNTVARRGAYCEECR